MPLGKDLHYYRVSFAELYRNLARMLTEAPLRKGFPVSELPIVGRSNPDLVAFRQPQDAGEPRWGPAALFHKDRSGGPLESMFPTVLDNTKRTRKPKQG